MCLAATPSASRTSDGATAVLSQLFGCCSCCFFVTTKIGVGGSAAASAAGVVAVVTACYERDRTGNCVCVFDSSSAQVE